jgi:hypothetical protein
MTRVRKGRGNAKVKPSEDETPQLAICFRDDTKVVLQRILGNAIACIAEEMLHDATGLGVLAAHLRAIAEGAHDASTIPRSTRDWKVMRSTSTCANNCKSAPKAGPICG